MLEEMHAETDSHLGGQRVRLRAVYSPEKV